MRLVQDEKKLKKAGGGRPILEKMRELVVPGESTLDFWKTLVELVFGEVVRFARQSLRLWVCVSLKT